MMKSFSASKTHTHIFTARGRTNVELREQFILANGVSQSMTPFISKVQHNTHAGSCKSSCSDLLPQFPSTGPITKVKKTRNTGLTPLSSSFCLSSGNESLSQSVSRLNVTMDTSQLESVSSRSVGPRGICKRDKLRKDHQSRSSHSLAYLRTEVNEQQSQSFTLDQLTVNGDDAPVVLRTRSKSNLDQKSDLLTASRLNRSFSNLNGFQSHLPVLDSNDSQRRVGHSFAEATQSSLQKQKCKVRKEPFYLISMTASPTRLNYNHI